MASYEFWGRVSTKFRIAILITFGCAIALWCGRRQFLSRIAGGASAGVPMAVPPKVEDVFGVKFDGKIQSDGMPAPWQSRVIWGKLQCSIEPGPSGENVLHILSDKAHFVVWTAVEPFAPTRYPTLTWSWKAIQIPKRGDVRTHAENPLWGDNRNDSALQVLVGFEGDDAICYKWDSNAPVGTEVEEWSPVARIRTRVVESGAGRVGEWVDQRVNIEDDYQRLYGKAPGRVIGVSVESNSNHTDAVGEGLVGRILFHAP